MTLTSRIAAPDDFRNAVTQALESKIAVWPNCSLAGSWSTGEAHLLRQREMIASLSDIDLLWLAGPLTEASRLSVEKGIANALVPFSLEHCRVSVRHVTELQGTPVLNGTDLCDRQAGDELRRTLLFWTALSGIEVQVRSLLYEKRFGAGVVSSYSVVKFILLLIKDIGILRGVACSDYRAAIAAVEDILPHDLAARLYEVKLGLREQLDRTDMLAVGEAALSGLSLRDLDRKSFSSLQDLVRGVVSCCSSRHTVDCRLLLAVARSEARTPLLQHILCHAERKLSYANQATTLGLRS